MDIVTTSLDALLQRASNPQNQNVDVAAVEAFAALINKEKDGAHIGVKLIATRIHSQNEKEVLQTLNILDMCMAKCGSAFHAEVGKFRFLNEMIKLVSPKYLGSQTPLTVRQKVLQLMYVWTLDFPKETKIKEAYDMLRKQGVIKEVPSLSISADGINCQRNNANSVFQDEEKSKLLHCLLQSKNPEDLQAANRLIKSMVKEDDRRAELKSKKTFELETVNHNVRLLNEMLDSYKPGCSSQDELDLIKELHDSCQRLSYTVFQLSSAVSCTEELLNDMVQTNSDLNQVFIKYTRVIVREEIKKKNRELHPMNNSLLDLESTDVSQVEAAVGTLNLDLKRENSQSDIDVLSDIFNATNIPDPILSNSSILLPMTVSKGDIQASNGMPSNTVQENPKNKLKALEEIDVLSEHLLRENLQTNTKSLKQFSRVPEKTPMNLLSKQNSISTESTEINSAINLDLNYLLEQTNDIKKTCKMNDRHNDDVLVDITDEKMLDNGFDRGEGDVTILEKSEAVPVTLKVNSEIKSATDDSKNSNTTNDVKLSDIFVTLESIKPSSVAPLTVVDEENGISVTLHFAKDKPREDVNVIVITTVSKNEQPMSSYFFQAVVPKCCKLKLQQPSGTSLPAYNPFLPPSAITQIMLVANPQRIDVSLKFIVSYLMDDETITKMGEVEKLPIL